MRVYSLSSSIFVLWTSLFSNSLAAVVGFNNTNSQPSTILLPANSTLVSTRCYTARATTPPAFPPTTSWSTRSTHCTLTATVIEIDVFTPSPVTRTQTSTIRLTVTAPTHVRTSIQSITSTITTDITTIVRTITTRTVIKSITSTSTVPASSGFVPIQSSIPDSSYFPNPPIGKAGVEEKRDVTSATPYSNSSVIDTPTNGTSRPPSYPQRVRCYELTPNCTTITITKTHTKTTSTPTEMATTNLMLTHTYVPQATTTITRLHTTISTNTITSIKTHTTATTTTIVAATKTFYEACATNNLINKIHDHYIVGWSFSGPASEEWAESYQNTPYDCCVWALTNPIGLNYFYGYPDHYCQVPQDSTCTGPRLGYPQGWDAGLWYQKSKKAWVVGGNGYCGQVTENGWD